MHDHSSPVLVPSLHDPPLKWFILVFRTCHPHLRSISQHFGGLFAPRPVTRPATLGRAFSLLGAVAGTIDTPYVFINMLLHIRKFSYLFR